jgi:SET domain-containing protein
MTKATKTKSSLRNSGSTKGYPLRLVSSRIHGRGVLAKEDIPAGQRIIEYTGERITNAEADRRYPFDESEPQHTFLFSVNSRTIIDAAHGGNVARFINHSCDPNCEAVIERGRVFIHAMRDIRAGEELGYDYWFVLDDRHSAANKALYPCRCGAKNCRGTLLADKRKARAYLGH